MRSYLLALSVLTYAAATYAQTLDDALRFSEVNPLGTARSLGTANSMAAIGADWTAVQANPAGLGMYRFNEITATPSVVFSGTRDAILDEGRSLTGDDNSTFALPQIALVLTREPIGSRWTQLNFGIGVSQTNRLEEQITFRGSSPGSISDLWLDEANFYDLSQGFRLTDEFTGLPLLSPNTRRRDELSPFGAGLALDVQALNASDGGTVPEFYFTDYDEFGRFVEEVTVTGTSIGDSTFLTRSLGTALEKEGTVTREGYSSAVDFSLAGNFEERLLIGATVGIVNTSFTESNLYGESDPLDSVAFFDRLSFRQNQIVDATGVLFRVGATYLVSPAFRIGLAYHSPTFMSVTDNYTATVEYTFTDPNEGTSSGSATSPNADVLEYNFRTPSQYRLSLGSVIGRNGFVGAELNYLDYSGGRFRFEEGTDPGNAEDDRNALLDSDLQAAFQVRLGGELKVNDFAVRLGAEYLQSPLTPIDDDAEEASFGFSGGLGYRAGRFSADAAYKINFRPDRTYRPYTVVPFDFPQPEVEYTSVLGYLAVTVGWKITPKITES